MKQKYMGNESLDAVIMEVLGYADKLEYLGLHSKAKNRKQQELRVLKRLHALLDASDLQSRRIA